MKKIILSILALNFAIMMGNAQDLQTDVFQTEKGELKIQFVKHGSIFFEFNGKVIHVDPVSRMGDYESYPKADLILITHHHGDHLDQNAIEILKKDNTKIVLTQKCKEMSEYLTDHIVMKNDDVLNINELEISAVPAYNIMHKRERGDPYHIKGEGNGYVVQFGNKKVYVAADTEPIPEMEALEEIDIAFLPMNMPYTMTPEMVADAARILKPKILYPYHYGTSDSTDTSKLVELLKDEKDIEVRTLISSAFSSTSVKTTSLIPHSLANKTLSIISEGAEALINSFISPLNSFFTDSKWRFVFSGAPILL